MKNQNKQTNKISNNLGMVRDIININLPHSERQSTRVDTLVQPSNTLRPSVDN